MVFKKFQMLAQIVGCVTIGLLAIYGLLMVLSADSPVWAAIAQAAPRLSAASSIPDTFNYQGFLREPDGSLTTGSYTITARIYYTGTGGTALYTTTVPNVTVRDGLFNIVLGDEWPLPPEAFSDTPRYIGISLNDDPELIPRQRVHAVPWALTANTLVDDATVNGLTSNGDVSVTGDLAVTGSMDADELTISGSKPIIFKKGVNLNLIPLPGFGWWGDTGVPNDQYVCGVVGYYANGGDIDEYSDTSMSLWASESAPPLVPPTGTWWVRFWFSYDDAWSTVGADVLCVDRGMAELQ